MRELFWQLMTDKEYEALKKLIETTIGINLNFNRRDFIENLLIKRFKELDVPDFKTYYKFIKNNTAEMKFLVNSITNTSTHFFRETHHFEYMMNHILPILASKSKMRLWSAGCSTGEEPYSIAVTLFEAIENINEYDIKILATDVNTEALEIAQKGIYNYTHTEKLREHPESFSIIEDDSHIKRIQINDFVKEIIFFKKLNLLDPWPIKNSFDIIFCRNVTIYLKPEITAQLFKRFDMLLNPGGFLFLGHSESLTLFKDRYVCLGKTIYQKVT